MVSSSLGGGGGGRPAAGAAGPLCSGGLFAGSLPHGLCKLGRAVVVAVSAHRTNEGRYGLLLEGQTCFHLLMDSAIMLLQGKQKEKNPAQGGWGWESMN